MVRRPSSGARGRAGTLAGCLVVAACARPTPGEPAGPLPTAAASAAAPAPDPRTYGWEAGQWYAYDLKLTTRVSFGGDSDTFDFDVTGPVQVTPTVVSPDAVTLYVAIADPKITSRVPGSQASLDKVAAELRATGCFFGLSGGRVTDMRAPRGFPAMAANTYREIGAAFQFAHTVPATEQYTSDEYDTTGQYAAEYLFDRGEGLWHKRKKRYFAILAAKNAPIGAPGKVVPQIDESDARVRLFPSGRPQEVDSKNTVTLGGAQLPVHSVTSVSLKAGASEPAKRPGPDWESLMAGMARTPADEPYGTEATLESVDAARMKGMTYDKAVAALERIASEKGGVVLSSVNGAPLDPAEQAKRERATEDKSRAFIALSAIFREQPQTIPLAIRRIREKSPAASTLVSALSAASTAASQRALVELANAKTTDPAMRDQVLASLSRTQRPDTKAIAAMKALLVADPFSEEGLLALGTYSRRLRDAGDTTQAEEIGALLVGTLKAATLQTDRLTALRAITNSGYAPALPYVVAALSAGEVEVRAAAVRSLQAMHDPKVDDILAERLRTDPASDVRISALTAVKVRSPTDVLAGAVENAAVSADDPHVRYRAVELLASWIDARPDIRPTLERIAGNDAEGRIRDRAQSAL